MNKFAELLTSGVQQQVPKEYEDEKKRDIAMNALIKAPMASNCFMTGAGTPVIVPQEKVEQIRKSAKSVQTTTIEVCESSQEECSPMTSPVGKITEETPTAQGPSTSGGHRLVPASVPFKSPLASAPGRSPVSNAPIKSPFAASPFGPKIPNTPFRSPVQRTSFKSPSIVVHPFPAKRALPEDLGAGDSAVPSGFKRPCIEHAPPLSIPPPLKRLTRYACPGSDLSAGIQSGGDVSSNGNVLKASEFPAAKKVRFATDEDETSISQEDCTIMAQGEDEFDDDFDDNWWSAIGRVTVTPSAAKDDGNLVTGNPRPPTIGEKSSYFSEQ